MTSSFKAWYAVAALFLAGCATEGQAQARPQSQAPSEPVAEKAEARLSPAEEASFAQWLQGFRGDALKRGVSAATFDKALGAAQPVARVVELDRKQPEFTTTFQSYLSKMVTNDRVEKGRKMLAQHKALLDHVAARHGVQPRFLVAFWGLETNFGATLGGFRTAEALATLAWDRRRPDFFREQLLALLTLMQKGDVAFDARGSWAGAMGHCQFMPTTYRDFAVDFDGDGRRDLWRSLPDVFASAAHYLGRTGWNPDQTWGREVLLPAGFDWELADGKTLGSLADWQALGVRANDGKNLPARNLEAALVLPSGHRGPAFLVYGNFKAIMTWNRSVFYAVAVGHLADRLAGGGGLSTPPNPRDLPLSYQEVVEIQQRLAALGHDIGEFDGVIGAKSRVAVKAFQRSLGLPPDGHADKDMLERLRGSPPAR